MISLWLRNDFLFFARRLAMTNALAPVGGAGGRYLCLSGRRRPMDCGGKPEECDEGTFNTLH